MAFLLSLMNPVSSSSLLFLARTWLVQLHNVCTSHASRPPAYVSQAWQGGLASTAHPCELFFHQAICTLKLSLPMGSPSSHLPTKTSNQYPRSPICRISKLLTTPPLLLTSRSNDPIAEKTQRSSSIYSPQMTSGGAACRMQAMLQTHMALRSVSQGLARFVAAASVKPLAVCVCRLRVCHLGCLFARPANAFAQR